MSTADQKRTVQAQAEIDAFLAGNDAFNATNDKEREANRAESEAFGNRCVAEATAKANEFLSKIRGDK